MRGRPRSGAGDGDQPGPFPEDVLRDCLEVLTWGLGLARYASAPLDRAWTVAEIDHLRGLPEVVATNSLGGLSYYVSVEQSAFLTALRRQRRKPVPELHSIWGRLGHYLESQGAPLRADEALGPWVARPPRDDAQEVGVAGFALPGAVVADCMLLVSIGLSSARRRVTCGDGPGAFAELDHVHNLPGIVAWRRLGGLAHFVSGERPYYRAALAEDGRALDAALPPIWGRLRAYLVSKGIRVD